MTAPLYYHVTLGPMTEAPPSVHYYVILNGEPAPKDMARILRAAADRLDGTEEKREKERESRIKQWEDIRESLGSLADDAKNGSRFSVKGRS